VIRQKCCFSLYKRSFDIWSFCFEHESKGLKIEYLEKDSQLQDLVLSVFHATTHTFSSTPAMKIIENQNGKAFIKIQN
ncbi:hypothetical protein LIQ27_20525, partial [Bacteroides fragilis]|nr:hypothetical protein [Bacteroides fragilis]